MTRDPFLRGLEQVKKFVSLCRAQNVRFTRDERVAAVCFVAGLVDAVTSAVVRTEAQAVEDSTIPAFTTWESGVILRDLGLPVNTV